MTEDEFREQVMPLRHLMYGLALRMGMPPDDAADAVQETQIRLWRSRDRIPIAETERRLYCMASMRNECLTWMRLKRDTEPIDRVNHPCSDVSEQVETQDMRTHIDGMIARLPHAQRDAIRLSAFGQLDNSEIADALGQTETNVRQLLSRGRKRLRDMMDKLGISSC